MTEYLDVEVKSWLLFILTTIPKSPSKFLERRSYEYVSKSGAKLLYFKEDFDVKMQSKTMKVFKPMLNGILEHLQSKQPLKIFGGNGSLCLTNLVMSHV